MLKISNCLPEIACLLLFTVFSCSWVYSYKKDEANSVQLSPILKLEKLIPQHEVQLLNANFSDQLHYDQLAQLQAELEALIFEVDVSVTSEQLLKNYKETSLSYTQLTSMLKTSQRLISEHSQYENTYLMRLIDDIRLKMFSFVSTPAQTDKNAILELLNEVDKYTSQQADWKNIQLVKLHSLFVLDNYELAATYRQELMEMPIVDTLIQEREQLRLQQKQSAKNRSVGLFGSILALVLLIIAVIKRQANELKKESEENKKFVDKIMDMIGPYASDELGNPILDEKHEDKSMRPGYR